MKSTDERRQMRGFGLVGGLILTGFALLLAETPWIRISLLGAAGYLALGGLLLQPLLRPVFRVWMKLAEGLGWFNTRLLLGLTFYLILTPMGLLQRLIRRDALRLARQQSETFWTPRPEPSADKSRYFRQF